MNSHIHITDKNTISSRFSVIPSITNLWRLFISTTFISILSLTYSISQAWGGDPFRTANPRNIGEQTELAFKALFEDGNYPLAREYLILAESEEQNDPMLPALRSALAYTEQDWQTMADYASKTVEVAKAIADQDPLRSNLYLAVGNFLEGAYQFTTDGPVAALNKLQLVFKYFDEAEKIDSNDPELNLIKGYLNLILAVNLPFSTPEQAIEKLQEDAYPQYLVNRGIALAYRDLDDYDLALVFVDKAIESTPINPELYYLKGQILRKKGQTENNIPLLKEALKNFDLALAKVEQLPLEAVRKPLKREKRKTLEKIEELTASGSDINLPVTPENDLRPPLTKEDEINLPVTSEDALNLPLTTEDDANLPFTPEDGAIPEVADDLDDLDNLNSPESSENQTLTNPIDESFPPTSTKNQPAIYSPIDDLRD